ncbi:uncharacterized protein MJAP1_003591 [Malassezia japonica]|uniref:Uncharacterized protein n=1 Tax=Malassezia japonica TaxID=223818 RepID=A0AAF0JBK7_9BASI|nr:uncharacterized protein MJAP1_003591 [Malassezia japonica]WFD40603.1 hypothetical protein MJAP1_003591 [Malassezia japonica]
MDDPGGVRALLAKLREQDEVPEQPRPEPSATQRPWASNPKRPAFLQQNETYDPWKPVFEEKSEPKAPAKDLRTMRFADALPIVTEKARDPVFIAELKRLEIPSFFETKDTDAIAMQRRIIQVLDGLLE